MKKDLAHRSCVGGGEGGSAVLPTLVPLNNVYYVHKIDVLAFLIPHPELKFLKYHKRVKIDFE